MTFHPIEDIYSAFSDAIGVGRFPTSHQPQVGILPTGLDEFLIQISWEILSYLTTGCDVGGFAITC